MVSRSFQVAEVPRPDDLLIGSARCSRSNVATENVVRVIEGNGPVSVNNEIARTRGPARHEPIGCVVMTLTSLDDPEQGGEAPVCGAIAVPSELRNVRDAISNLKARREGTTSTQGGDRRHRRFEVGFASAGSIHEWSKSVALDRYSTGGSPTQRAVGRQERAPRWTRHDHIPRRTDSTA